jgi:type II secretion system protein I
MSKERGFTLIELLVALAILAIALTGALMLMSHSSRHLLKIKDRILAQWVADNTLAKIQIGLIHLQDYRPYTGTQHELTQRFSVKAVATTQYAHADAIRIQVGLTAGHPLVTLRGWHWHNAAEDSR